MVQCAGRSGPGRPREHAGHDDVPGRGGRGLASATHPVGTSTRGVPMYVMFFVCRFKCCGVSDAGRVSVVISDCV